MTSAVVLSEYQDKPVTLSIEDATFIAIQLRGRVTIRRAFSGPGYILNSRQFVGLVGLPSGRQLECWPKVPASNLFSMLAIAYELPNPFLDESAKVGSIDEVLIVVAARFTSMVEERINRGLYRAYVEEESNLSTVRGRILISEDVRRNYILRHRTYCQYTEYSWDVSDNRVLRQVVRLLSGLSLPSAVRHRLRTLDAVMEDVTPGRYVAADLDQFVYNRLNVNYQPLHKLCRFFLEVTSPSDQSGPFDFQGFLLDMNRLFEGFVTQVLKTQVPAPFTVHAQSSSSLDLADEVRLRPDLLIRRGQHTVVVGDCKYKRIQAGEHRHQDLYQLLAYCTALDVRQGLLIYPQHLAPVDTSMVVRNSDVSIFEVTIDLSGDVNGLSASCEALLEAVLDLARADDPLIPC